MVRECFARVGAGLQACRGAAGGEAGRRGTAGNRGVVCNGGDDRTEGFCGVK